MTVMTVETMSWRELTGCGQGYGNFTYSGIRKRGGEERVDQRIQSKALERQKHDQNEKFGRSRQLNHARTNECENTGFWEGN